MKKILLIEDDPALGETMSERLVREGYETNWANSISQANKFLNQNKFDLIVIDVGLPDGDGFQFAEQVKKTCSTPFIFVTAMNSPEHRLRGYELGADEYIPKPFHLREFLLRVKKAVDKVQEPKIIVVGKCEIDLGAMSVKFSDGRVEYPTSRDFKILRFLINAAPRVVSREELIREIVSDPGDSTPTHRTIDNSIVRLRQLFELEAPNAIRAVRGVGYQWLGT